jgi:hypothetical protein
MPPRDKPLFLTARPQGDETVDPSNRWFGMSERILPFSLRLPQDYPSVPPALLDLEWRYFHTFAKAVADHASVDIISERSFKKIRPEAKFKRLIMVMSLENLHTDPGSGVFTWEGFRVHVGDFPVVKCLFRAKPSTGKGAILSVSFFEAHRNDYTTVAFSNPLTCREDALMILFTYFQREGVLAPRKDLDPEE